MLVNIARDDSTMPGLLVTAGVDGASRDGERGLEALAEGRTPAVAQDEPTPPLPAATARGSPLVRPARRSQRARAWPTPAARPLDAGHLDASARWFSRSARPPAVNAQVRLRARHGVEPRQAPSRAAALARRGQSRG